MSGGPKREKCPTGASTRETHLSTKQHPRFINVKPVPATPTVSRMYIASMTLNDDPLTDHGNDVSTLSPVELAQRRKDERPASEPDEVERERQGRDFLAGAVALLDHRNVGDDNGRVGRALPDTGSV